MVLGLEEPLNYQDLEDRDFQFSPEFLKTNLVTEVDVCVLSSLCSNVALAIGYTMQSNRGKSGPQLLKKYTETIKIASCCEAFIKSEAPYLNSIKPQVVKKCSRYCPDCWSCKLVCESCASKGRKTIFPQIEACFPCIEKGIQCRKNVVTIVALDCYSGNRAMMEKYNKQRLEGTRDPEVYLTEPIGEIVHILKTIKSSSSNWYILTPAGHLFSLAMLRTLRDENDNKQISNILKTVLKKSSVVNRDKQDTDCLLEFSNSVDPLKKIAQIDPRMVHQIVPEKFKIEPSNKPGDIGAIVSLGAVDINHVAVLFKEKDQFRLSFLELHSPVKIKKSDMKEDAVISMITSEGLIVYSNPHGLEFIEIVKGTVFPKIPKKKADLVAL